MAEEFLSITQLAARLDIPDRVIRALIKQGKIPYKRIGKAIRFRWKAIEAWYDELPGSDPRKANTANFKDTFSATNGIQASPDDTSAPPIPFSRGARRHKVAPAVQQRAK